MIVEEDLTVSKKLFGLQCDKTNTSNRSVSEDRSRQRRDDVLAEKSRLLKKITTYENQDQKDHPSLSLLSVSKSEHTNWQLQLPTTQENAGKHQKLNIIFALMH